jgi:peptidoglycan/xylan/chitin deacetylase (PgdA/CDA1 family)
LASPHPKPEFYDIPASTLDNHLQILTRSSLHPLKPEELLEKAPGKPSFMLSFDDGTIDHFEVVLPLLLRYSCRAIFFVPTAKLNRAGYMTDRMISALPGRAIRWLAQPRTSAHGHDERRGNP